MLGHNTYNTDIASWGTKYQQSCGTKKWKLHLLPKCTECTSKFVPSLQQQRLQKEDKLDAGIKNRQMHQLQQINVGQKLLHWCYCELHRRKRWQGIFNDSFSQSNVFVPWKDMFDYKNDTDTLIEELLPLENMISTYHKKENLLQEYKNTKWRTLTLRTVITNILSSMNIFETIWGQVLIYHKT